MIDRQQFNRAWKTLCRGFQREPDAEEAALYREWLSERMDTEQFVEAARHVWAHREFFPRPVDFVEAVGGGAEDRALEQWELCQRVMSGSDEALAEMSKAGRQAIRLMGGVRQLRNTRLDRVDFVRREFTRLCARTEAAARRGARRELPAANGDRMLPDGEPAPEQPSRNGDGPTKPAEQAEDERRRVREILAETRKTLGVQSEQPSSPGKRRTGKVRRPPPRPPSREEQQRRLQERMAKAGAGASQEEGA